VGHPLTAPMICQPKIQFGISRIEDVALTASTASLSNAGATTLAARLAGAIVGRALYDGRLNASEALRLIRAARQR